MILPTTNLVNWRVGVSLKDVEADTIKQALAYCHGNMTMAAGILRISKSALLRKVRMYKIDLKAVRKDARAWRKE